MDPVLHDAFDRLLTDISTPQVIREIEAGGSAQDLWQQVIESGFADAMVSEQSGGAGLKMGDAFSLFFLCGLHALPIPLPQTMVGTEFAGPTSQVVTNRAPRSAPTGPLV